MMYLNKMARRVMYLTVPTLSRDHENDNLYESAQFHATIQRKLLFFIFPFIT